MGVVFRAGVLDDMPLSVFDWIEWDVPPVPRKRVVHVTKDGTRVVWEDAAMWCVAHGDVRTRSIGRVALLRTRDNDPYTAMWCFNEIVRADPTYWGVYFWYGVFGSPIFAAQSWPNGQVGLIVKGIELRDDVCAEMWKELYMCMSAGTTVCVLGETLSELDVCARMVACDVTRAESYVQLSRILSERLVNSISLLDGRRMDERELLLEALRLDPMCVDACYAVTACKSLACACGMSKWAHVHLDDAGWVMTLYAMYATIIRADPHVTCPARWCLYELSVKHNPGWSRLLPAEMWGLETARLFGTLLMGMNRLETMGVLTSVHHSVVEDMLENWMYFDDLSFSGPRRV